MGGLGRILLSLLLLGTAPASGAACFQECLAQGYGSGQCAALCERGSRGPGLIEQPGVPRNPYLDALPDPLPRQRPAQQRLDPRCLDDCQARRYQYDYCRRQCSY
jgi:hypothetical protein